MQKVNRIKELREAVEGYFERDFQEWNQMKEILFGEKMNPESRKFVESLNPFKVNLLTKVLIGEMKLEEANQVMGEKIIETIEEFKKIQEKSKEKSSFISKILELFSITSFYWRLRLNPSFVQFFSLWLSGITKLLEKTINGASFNFSQEIIKKIKKIIEVSIDISQKKQISPKLVLISDNYYPEVIKKVYSRKTFEQELRNDTLKFIEDLANIEEKIVNTYINEVIDKFFSQMKKELSEKEKMKYREIIFKTLNSLEQFPQPEIKTVFPFFNFFFPKIQEERPELKGKEAVNKLRELKKKAEKAKNNVEMYINIKMEEIWGKE
jgi:hypothetical protein